LPSRLPSWLPSWLPSMAAEHGCDWQYPHALRVGLSGGSPGSRIDSQPWSYARSKCRLILTTCTGTLLRSQGTNQLQIFPFAFWYSTHRQASIQGISRKLAGCQAGNFRQETSGRKQMQHFSKPFRSKPCVVLGDGRLWFSIRIHKNYPNIDPHCHVISWTSSGL